MSKKTTSIDLLQAIKTNNSYLYKNILDIYVKHQIAFIYCNIFCNIALKLKYKTYKRLLKKFHLLKLGI